MSRSSVTIWYDPNLQGYHIECPFNRSFIDFLKASIPASDRAFDPNKKTWSFSEKYLDAVVATAEQFYGKSNVSVLTKDKVNQASQAPAAESQTLDAALLAFMKLLPFEAAQAAYRKASMALHPDRGGDMTKMSQLNVLWTRIEQEVYKP